MSKFIWFNFIQTLHSNRIDYDMEEEKIAYNDDDGQRKKREDNKKV